ncbi:MAG: trypsin-like serine protease [Oligoflexales bacterium]|nr:trypsin-like serine protease [Oligoflexales bacterium]
MQKTMLRMICLSIGIGAAFSCKHKTIKPINKESCDLKEGTLNCSNMAESPSFQLIDGDVISYQEFPSVHILYNARSKSFCTGTFVKANLMITAGHCIQDPKQAKNSFAILEPKVVDGSITSFNVKAWSVGFKINPEYELMAKLYGTASFNAFLLDVGFVVFPDNTSETYRDFNFERIPYGEVIELVGFGKHARKKQTDLRKRTGTNEIVEEVYHKDFIEIEQVIDFWRVDPEKGDTGVLPGDSGGPMLHNEKIIGIVSGYSYKRRLIFWKRDIRGIFAELAWKQNQEFVRQTIEQLGQKNKQ